MDHLTQLIKGVGHFFIHLILQGKLEYQILAPIPPRCLNIAILGETEWQIPCISNRLRFLRYIKGKNGRPFHRNFHFNHNGPSGR